MVRNFPHLTGRWQSYGLFQAMGKKTWYELRFEASRLNTATSKADTSTESVAFDRPISIVQWKTVDRLSEKFEKNSQDELHKSC